MKTQTSMDERIAFVGAGHMAGALVGGLLRTGLARPGQLTATDVDEAQCARFQSAHGVRTTSDKQAMLREAAVVVLAVKPQVLGSVLAEVAPWIHAGQVVLSIAAGFPLRRIEAALPEGVPVVRAMPNMPARIGMGITAICAGTRAGERVMATAETLLRSAGRVVRVSEAEMDAVTAISGSGPAYVFVWMEAMLEAARGLGLNAELARELVLSTVEGAAGLAREADEEPAELRRQVTSKGGVTAEALDVLAAAQVPNHLIRAIQAAHARAQALAEQIETDSPSD